MEIVPMIIATIIGIIIVSVIIYFTLRYLKGSLKINLNQGNLTSGNNISGTIELKAKKQIISNGLTIDLVCFETYREFRNGRSRRREREIFRSSQIIDQAKTYSSGTKLSMPFNLIIPYQESIRGANISSGNQMINGALNAMKSFMGKSLRWELQSRVDCDGVDLASSKRIGISLTSQSSSLNQTSIQN